MFSIIEEKKEANTRLRHGRTVIFHIDVNSAFLSWEAVYRLHHLGGKEDLRNMVSAVGGDMAMRHGIILAKSIPAKKYQIKTGETIVEARQKCPGLFLVPPNYGLYEKCSKAFMDILRQYSPAVEQYSIDEAFVDSVLDQFESGDMVVLQNEINGLGSLIEKAAGRGMRVMLNPAPFDDSIFSLPLEKVSMLFVNEIEGAAMAHLSSSAGYDEILGRLSSLYPDSGIILTAGENGAFYASGSTRFSCSAVRCEAADTTGAGDTFIGYFIAGCERGYDIPEALRFASSAASIAVSRHGAMESIPFLREVETI